MGEFSYTKNTKLSVLTKEGFKSFTKIRSSTKKTITIKFTNTDEYITVTPNHRFYFDDTGENIKLAEELVIDDWISHEKFGFLKVESITENVPELVYDVVDVNNDNHSYITNGLNSHNCEFQGASSTLIPPEILIDLNDKIKDPIATQYGGFLKIYEEPIAGAEYVLSVDPAEGLGRDYSACQVLRVMNAQDNKPDEYLKLKQVATYRSNTVRLKKFTQTAIGIGRYYNNAWAMIENNNSCGGLCCHYFWHEYEYENMINPTKGKNGKLGINANVKSKFDANMKLVQLLDTFQLELCDADTIEELNAYEEIRPSVYAAGNTTVHDDTVTSLLWGIMFLESKYYAGYKEEYGSDIDEEYVISAPVFKTSNPNR